VNPEVVLVEGEKAAKDGIRYVAREEARNMRDKDAAVPVSNGWGGINSQAGL
jgi:hypothetical protein